MQSCRLYKDSLKQLPEMAKPSLSSSPIFAFFGLLFDLGLILAENCFVTSNARTVDWQAGDCVLLAHAE
jgi:hypothetical protein